MTRPVTNVISRPNCLCLFLHSRSGVTVRSPVKRAIQIAEQTAIEAASQPPQFCVRAIPAHYLRVGGASVGWTCIGVGTKGDFFAGRIKRPKSRRRRHFMGGWQPDRSLSFLSPSLPSVSGNI